MPTIREEIIVFGSSVIDEAISAGLTPTRKSRTSRAGYMMFDFVDSENDPECERAKSWIQQSEARYQSYRTIAYSTEELKNSSWVCVRVRVSDVIESDASARKRVSGKCYVCGAFNQFEGPVFPLEPSSEGKVLLGTNAGEWLIRKDVCGIYADKIGDQIKNIMKNDGAVDFKRRRIPGRRGR